MHEAIHRRYTCANVARLTSVSQFFVLTCDHGLAWGWQEVNFVELLPPNGDEAYATLKKEDGSLAGEPNTLTSFGCAHCYGMQFTLNSRVHFVLCSKIQS